MYGRALHTMPTLRRDKVKLMLLKTSTHIKIAMTNSNTSHHTTHWKNKQWYQSTCLNTRRLPKEHPDHAHPHKYHCFVVLKHVHMNSLVRINNSIFFVSHAINLFCYWVTSMSIETTLEFCSFMQIFKRREDMDK